MTLFHAVVRIDDQVAQVMQFDASGVQVQRVKGHRRDLGRPGNGAQPEQVFFARLCDDLAGIGTVLVTGPQTALNRFRDYASLHHPAVAVQLVTWETSDQPSEADLVRFARQYFLSHQNIADVTGSTGASTR